jgi:hypothetical protein
MRGPELAAAVTPRSLVSSVIRALSGTMPSGGNRTSRADGGSEASGEGSSGVDQNFPYSRPNVTEIRFAPEADAVFRSMGVLTQESLEQERTSATDSLKPLFSVDSPREEGFLDGRNREIGNCQILTESQPTSFGRDFSSPPVIARTPLLDFSGREISTPFRRHISYHGMSERVLTPSHLNPGLGSLERAERESFAHMGSGTRNGRVSLDNVTQRDSKRPSARPRDREYHRRFSHVASLPSRSPDPVGGQPWPPDNPCARSARSVVAVDFDLTPPQSTNNVRNATVLPSGGRGDGSYYVRLICAGDTVRIRVWPSMSISELTEDAGRIFGLDPPTISLLLFTMPPVSLRRDATIAGPPLVAPDSAVMVFSHVAPMDHARNFGSHTPPPPHGHIGHGNVQYSLPPSTVPLVKSKLLSTFKLPKFDGVSKNWKAWDRAFQRFLGMHQLDHVLEDGFLDTIWHAPGAKEANKFVYFLLEDAVSVGSLASKYIRQATKWNGHEAYILLHNGYVFSAHNLLRSCWRN